MSIKGWTILRSINVLMLNILLQSVFQSLHLPFRSIISNRVSKQIKRCQAFLLLLVTFLSRKLGTIKTKSIYCFTKIINHVAGPINSSTLSRYYDGGNVYISHILLIISVHYLSMQTKYFIETHYYKRYLIWNELNFLDHSTCKLIERLKLTCN